MKEESKPGKGYTQFYLVLDKQWFRNDDILKQFKGSNMLKYNEKYLAGDVEPQGEDNILDIKDILDPESAQKVIDAYMVVKEFENMLDGVDDCEEE
jgi:hypothetical protein